MERLATSPPYQLQSAGLWTTDEATSGSAVLNVCSPPATPESKFRRKRFHAAAFSRRLTQH